MFILPSALFLSSCVLGPELGTPASTLTSTLRGDSAPHGASFGDKAWRTVFTDPSLSDLIERALKNNPDLMAATFRIEEAGALVGATRAA